MMSDKEIQRDEIFALNCIYNEEELQVQEENGLSEGIFYAYVDLPPGFRVIYKDLRQEDSSLQEFEVNYLPPLSLHFTLPYDYPQHSPPTYKLSCYWLNNDKLAQLYMKLDDIWKEIQGTEVLYLWTDFLKTETLNYLHIIEVLDISELETTFLKLEEFKLARRTQQFEEEKQKSDEPTKEVCAPVSKPSPPEHLPQRRRHWGGHHKWHSQRLGEQKTEESQGSSSVGSKNISTVVYDSRNGKFYSQSRRGGEQRSYRYRGRGYNRIDNNCDSGFARKHDNQTHNKQVVAENQTHNKQVVTDQVNISSSSDNIIAEQDKSDCGINGKLEQKASSSVDETLTVNKNRRFYSHPTRQRGRRNYTYHTREKNKVDSNCESDLSRKENKRENQVCSEQIVAEEVNISSKSIEGGAKQDSCDVNEVPEQKSDGAEVGDKKKGGLPNRPRMSVVQLLQEYNQARKRTEFSRQFYTCKICFQDKKGQQCMKFDDCSHVFCKSCMAEYFEVRIKDGTVKSIACPEEKCTSEASPSQVQELVSAEMFSRYDSVLLSALLDTMEDMQYCPRPACQYPVAMEPGEKMATCPSCNYVFCIFCKMVYHGIEPCRFRAHEKRLLVEEYNNASVERRSEMEQRYGKKQLQNLVDTYLSENWLDSNSKKCPSCSAAIEKSDGCNKMVCWKCNTFFCWLCEERLNPQTPYMHFNNPASKCYNLLFHGVPLSDDEDDDHWNLFVNLE